MDYFEFNIRVPKQPWKWIRFRITTILLLVAIVAIAFAWRRDHAELSRELYQLRHPGPNYESAQVTGPPNTSAGDGATAWCSLSADDQSEWLLLDYDKAVMPKAIIVHENLCPGAVRRVSHYPRFGAEQILWEGDDPTPASANSGVSRLPTTAGIKTNRIKLYLDSPAVPGWNEIDAVGIVYGEDDKVIWAKRASASSSYSDQYNHAWGSSGIVLTR